MSGYYYAHIPSLGITTHGEGIPGAMSAARDLIQLWLEEKHSADEQIFVPSEAVLATVEVG